MDVLYTSFLRDLVSASNRIKIREDIQEREYLNILAFLSLKIKESEALIEEFRRRNTGQHTLASLA